jgi:hypothetical protein
MVTALGVPPAGDRVGAGAAVKAPLEPRVVSWTAAWY